MLEKYKRVNKKTVKKKAVKRKAKKVSLNLSLPEIQLSMDDANQIHRAVKFLCNSKYPNSLHGLVKESKKAWVTTSIEYDQWHCHGEGKTAKAAIKDMIKQIKKHHIKDVKN